MQSVRSVMRCGPLFGKWATTCSVVALTQWLLASPAIRISLARREINAQTVDRTSGRKRSGNPWAKLHPSVTVGAFESRRNGSIKVCRRRRLWRPRCPVLRAQTRMSCRIPHLASKRGKVAGAPGWDRTSNPCLRRAVLYPLSYGRRGRIVASRSASGRVARARCGGGSGRQWHDRAGLRVDDPPFII